MCDDELGGLRKAFFFFFFNYKRKSCSDRKFKCYKQDKWPRGGSGHPAPNLSLGSSPRQLVPSWKVSSSSGPCAGATGHPPPPHAHFSVNTSGSQCFFDACVGQVLPHPQTPRAGQEPASPETGRPRFALAPSGAAPTRHGTCPACASFQMCEVQGHGRPPVADIVLETGCWVLTLDMQ